MSDEERIAAFRASLDEFIKWLREERNQRSEHLQMLKKIIKHHSSSESKGARV